MIELLTGEFNLCSCKVLDGFSRKIVLMLLFCLSKTYRRLQVI